MIERGLIQRITGGTVPSITSSQLPDPTTVPAGSIRYVSDIGGGVNMQSNGTNWVPLVRQNPYYFFHGFAGNQISGDPSFLDMSGNFNDGIFGASLSNSAAWINAGYVTTVAPSSNDSSIHMPNLNFDYQNGETLIFYWLGSGAAPASTLPWAGDGFANTFSGINIRAATTGKVSLVINQTSTTSFSGTATNATFDGNIHSFGLVLQGWNGGPFQHTYSMWQDEVLDAFNTNNSLSSTNNIDTRNSNTFNLGTSLPYGQSTSNGIAIKTRLCVILRLPSTKLPPSNATITNVFKQLRRNPSSIILNSVI